MTKVIAASLLASTVCAFLHEDKLEWEGTTKDLLDELSKPLDDHILRNRKLWPQTNKALSERLKRDAPALRRSGIEYEHLKKNGGTRYIRIYRTPKGLNAAPPAPCPPGLTKVINNDKSAKPEATKNKQPKWARKKPKK